MSCLIRLPLQNYPLASRTSSPQTLYCLCFHRQILSFFWKTSQILSYLLLDRSIQIYHINSSHLSFPCWVTERLIIKRVSFTTSLAAPVV